MWKRWKKQRFRERVSQTRPSAAAFADEGHKPRYADGLERLQKTRKQLLP